ncbi:uncharacterized protein IP90_00248 [Luteimonas cucumeris]|uniref:DUF418 domain-containing protein n=1 Tax=Luteimonas cucumeris TaxID=985012 RepID=A0A562LEJ2_9GAMM|nr:DUF418 domain-containing protein [Luteimonas cucumeris]TWI05986.1 uncharacterized protein IP90_00248 [Luteimonas cucumeris]
MSPDAVVSPTPAPERHELIDALRGFALCGVLLANLSAFSLYEYLTATAQQALPTAAFDRVAEHALQLLLTHKAVTVFSILFGFGFAMQLERAQARGVDGLPVFLRRMSVLLAMGLLHSAFWWGDILLVYAIAGFALVPMRRWSDRWLVWGGFSIALLGTALVRGWFTATSQKTGPLSRAEVFADALQGLSSPSLIATFEGNAALLRWWYPLGGLMLVCFALGRFMLGHWANRRHLLQQPETQRPLLRRILVWTLPLGVATTLPPFWQASIKQAWPLLDAGIGAMLWSVFVLAGPLLLGIAFGIVFVLLYLHRGWQRRLRHFAPAGRMALSNYLMQTVVCSAIFYGYGLGVGPSLGTPAWFTIWVLLFGAQMAISRWWLSRFRFGPMEWLWRTLTYGRLQPMRLQEPALATRESAG